VPYWTCQNSWGGQWGEGGLFRIVRGRDTCGIESTSGLVVAAPRLPTACPRAACAAGATTLRDCTCWCPRGRAGPTCSACTLECGNGGARDGACRACACPAGFWGPGCEAGYHVSALAGCAADAADHLTVSYTFPSPPAGSVPPPTQGSFVGIYPLGERNPVRHVAMGYVCGPPVALYDPGDQRGYGGWVAASL
jgi:hypothetical protein